MAGAPCTLEIDLSLGDWYSELLQLDLCAVTGNFSR